MMLHTSRYVIAVYFFFAINDAFRGIAEDRLNIHEKLEYILTIELPTATAVLAVLTPSHFTALILVLLNQCVPV